MRKNKILLTSTLIVFLLGGMFASCSKKENSSSSLNSSEASSSLKTLEIRNLTLTENAKYNSAIINYTISDFNNLGFAFGDSVNVTFSNGKSIDDVPYYNGYYVKDGQPILVGYTTSTNLSITYYGDGIWTTLGLTSDTTIDIVLNEKGKYLASQEAFNLDYSSDRNSYSSDEEFCNFRAVSCSKIKDNLIYRGASPLDTRKNRASYTDSLLSKYGIECSLNLSNKVSDVEQYQKQYQEESKTSYYLDLYAQNKVKVLGLGSFSTESFKKGFVEGLKFYLQNSGKVYIHCTEGKDRTGFACFVLEALVGSSFEEMQNDYMLSFWNYFKIDSSSPKYKLISDLYLTMMVETLNKDLKESEYNTHDFSEDAKNYLISGGMSETEVNSLIDIIKK